MEINEDAICMYAFKTPLDNDMCLRCELFLNTCSPIATDDGYASGSEYGCFLCGGCQNYGCLYHNSQELWG